jgi:DNA-binding Xre family transcriptional regulator
MNLSTNSTDITLSNVLTENDLCELLGMKKEQLADLRNQKKLPFIRLSKTRRLYFEQDLIKFFQSLRTVLNEDE